MAARKNPEVADVENRFAFHPATETTGPKHDAVRATLLRVAKQMQRDLPDGREKSLVLTKLEETMFWANAAIARHQDVASSAAPAAQPEQGTDVQVPPAARRRKAAVEKQTAAKKTTKRSMRQVRRSQRTTS